MQSLFKLVFRRIGLRKGVFSATIFLFLAGLFIIYHFTNQSDLLLVESNTRTIKVPHDGENQKNIQRDSREPVLPSKSNHSNIANNSHLNHLKHGPVLQPGVQILTSDTPECQFSSAPSEGRFNIQMGPLLDSFSFDNPKGVPWTQGFPITYSMSDFSTPLQVFLVPHSHNDPGWIRTFEDYYRRQTRNILTLMIDSLSSDPRKKFIWAEISYLALWWSDQNQERRDKLRRIVSSGQLEIVTGGWVMNDEANTHYFAMLDQLIEGHLWMQQNLPGSYPLTGWAIDPFGYSPTMAYLLKGCGLHSMLIQRAHYAVKRHFAWNKQLEFKWMQEWDASYSTSIFCHLMPFYSYDIPHTCGPNPKVCCQFDFNRLRGSKITCPWKVRPQPIADNNIKERAETLADQYRKKSMLFKTNVLLVPLGDDFRWDTQKEITAQFENYYKLIDYINSHPEMKMKIQFGTLREYFNTLHKYYTDQLSNVPAHPVSFPTLSGDFFTYCDREDDYWSGYYTSRPFYKHMTRVLEYNLRMAEIFFSLAVARSASLEPNLQPRDKLTEARRNLGLFQHHDGITGTAKEAVVIDYAKRMISAITQSKDVTRAALKALLVEHSEGDQERVISGMSFNPEERYPSVKELPSQDVININSGGQYVVSFVNSLAHSRSQLVSVLVNSPNVMVKDASNVTLISQINPVFNDKEIAKDKFKLVFLATIPPLGVAHYLIESGNEKSVRATVQYINFKPSARSDIFHTEEFPNNDIVLSTDLNISAKFSGQTGLLKTITVGSSEVMVDLDFVSYGTRANIKERSGAYLFLPDREASSIVTSQGKPKISLVAGPLMQEVTSNIGLVQHSVILSNSPGLDGRSITIHNLVDVSSQSNKEIAMRFRSSIDNENGIFYTDLNGFQFTKRKISSKLPIQGNFYPMPTASLLQDRKNRLTLYSSQPLGVSSLRPGWLEVILDRRLMQDDHRGLGQGLKDNVLTFESFKLVIERRLNNANSTASLIYPSLLAQHTVDSLLHPPAIFISPSSSFIPSPYSFMQEELPCDMFLLNLRSIFQPDQRTLESALILHRRGIECGFDMNPLTCDLNDGQIKLGRIFKDVTISEATETSLSLLNDTTRLNFQSDLMTHIDEMHIKTYRVAW